MSDKLITFDAEMAMLQAYADWLRELAAATEHPYVGVPSDLEMAIA